MAAANIGIRGAMGGVLGRGGSKAHQGQGRGVAPANEGDEERREHEGVACALSIHQMIGPVMTSHVTRDPAGPDETECRASIATLSG